MPRMQTCLLPTSMQLAKVDGVLNAVAYDAEPVGSIVLNGPGRGRGRHRRFCRYYRCCLRAHSLCLWPSGGDVADGNKVENGGGPDTPFYVRLMVVDKPGVLADVTSVLQTHDISVDHCCSRGARRRMLSRL